MTLAVDLEGRILDAHLDRWELVTAGGKVLKDDVRQVGSEAETALILERRRPTQGLSLRASDFAGNSVEVPLDGPAREVRVTLQGLRGMPLVVGPTEPGPTAPVAPQFTPPRLSVFWSAEASFEPVEFLFRYRAEGAQSFTELATTGSAGFSGEELELGTSYEGHFSADGIRSQEFSFIIGPDAIFVAVEPGVVRFTSTIDEELVEGSLLMTVGGETTVLKVYRPLPPNDNLLFAPPPCGVAASFRVEAIGVSSRRYQSTTRLAYPNPAPAVIARGGCLSVDDAGVQSAPELEAPVPMVATALLVNGLTELPDSISLLLHRGNEVTEVANVPGVLGPIRVSFDAGGLAEGRYRLTARANYQGNSVDADYGVSFVLDQTPPEAAILGPPENESVCVIGENEKELIELEVRASDQLIEAIRLEVREGGEWRALGLPADLGLPAPLLQRTIRAQLPVGLEGAQTFRLVARGARLVGESAERPAPGNPPPWPNSDNNGSLLSAATRNLVLIRSEALGALTTEPGNPALFSPNADTRFDTMRLDGELLEAASLTVTAHRQNELVRTIVSGRASPVGPFQIIWDGRDDNGDFVSDGEYRIEVEAVNGCGATSSGDVGVEVDVTPPEAVLTTPTEGQPLSGAVGIEGTARDLHFESYVLEFGEGPAPISFEEIQPPQSVPRVETLLGFWSVGELPPGVFTLRLRATDIVGNEAEARVTVDVQRTDFIAGFDAAPDVFSPNGDNVQDESLVTLSLKAEARVTLEIRTPAEVLVRTLLDAELLTEGEHSFVWDGEGQAGPVADGDYVAVLVAANPANELLKEDVSRPLVVDTVPPAIDLTSPVEAGFVSLPGEASGSISDPNLERYQVSIGPAERSRGRGLPPRGRGE